MDRGILHLLILICCLNAAYGGPVYTDCEHPPTILHGKTELSVDEDGIIVTAIYSCDPSYQLHGSSQLTCNTDNDIWQGDLPVCKLETGGDSTVSEIEPPVVIEPFATVPPEMTHQELETSEVQEVQEAVTVLTETAEVTSDSNSNPSPDTYSEQVENEVLENQITVSEAPQKKRHRKPKPDMQEDNTIDDEFASRLDTSCLVAPNIVNAYIVEYDSRKHGEYEFLVAIYACEQNYDFENPSVNLMYCSNENWIGTPPVCVSKGGSDEYDDYNDNENRITNSHPSTKDEKNEVEVEPETDHNDVSSAIEKNENKNLVEITNNEVFSQFGTDESANEINKVHKNQPNVATCDVNNGGCDQICNMVQNENSDALIVECSCSLGYYLDLEEETHCIDINECENPKIEESCLNGCENTIGSYNCIQSVPEAEVFSTNEGNVSPTGEPNKPTVEPNAPVKACGDGFRMDDFNNCIDIDECSEGNTGCEHCHNLSGSFECVCPAGFRLDSDSKTCRDNDECKEVLEDDYEENAPAEKTICSHECVNTIGSYICKCPLNFHLGDDKRSCEQDFCRHLSDIDSNKTKCSHDCVDDVNGYHCKCPEGMELDIDLKNCVVLDACQSSGDRCSPGKCVNIEGGSFGCECPAGYAAYNQRCVDYDECAIASHKCSHKCKNTPGSYICQCPNDLILATDQHHCISRDHCQNNNGGCSDMCNVINENVICSCPDGFELESDAKTCRSINICAKNNGGCQHVCNEELNSCECHAGFKTFDEGKTCHDLNECLNNPCAQQCLNTEGSYECQCFDGFVKDPSTGECTDINECLSSNHQCEHGCQNTEGAYVCICNDGYQLAENGLNCIDVNECNVNNGGCSHTCINLPGTHKCTCPEGQFLVNDDQTCDFLNLCEMYNGGCSDICNFKQGILSCSCPNGYELDASGKHCIDINECLINNGGCHHSCENLIGSLVCKCNTGFQLASDGAKCVDLDECIENNGNCSNICINLFGSHSCACEAGYELDVDGRRCIDIDECANRMDDCSHTCINVPGGYECECHTGYKLSRDHFTCDDINECLSTDACDSSANCINNEGSFSCECDKSLTLADDKRTCIESIDPCAIKNGGCSHVCEPLNGKPQCYCYKGFELSLRDNTTCIDIDECLLNHGCDNKCINTIGSYKCDCQKGFQMNGAGTCEDVNECLMGVCSSNSECINFIGGYRCICLPGYRMDREKKTCVQLEIKDNCPALVPPINGDVSCSRSRHRSQNFHRTKCSVWCHEGFTLIGPSIRYCNGSTGFWDSAENSCVRSTCPALSPPSHGSFNSPNCFNGNVKPGESCTLTCAQGFKSVGNPLATCLPGRVWSTSVFECVAVKTEQNLPKKRVNQGGNYQRGHINLDERVLVSQQVPITQQVSYRASQQPRRQSQNHNQNILRPYIKCPRDTIILIKNNHLTAFIKLEQPKSNVDWASHIDVEPAGAKSLQMRLPIGVHTFKFTAHSPNSMAITDTCQTVITVKKFADVPATQNNLALSSQPEVVFCPQNIHIQLQMNELRRAVSWKEPIFRPIYPLKQIFKSSIPGTKFGPGHHRITYIATDHQNKNGTCQFSVIVRAPVAVNTVQSKQQPYLKDHDSYLMCPNRPAMKLDTSFPVQIPTGCFIKNVRINHYNPHRRRHAFSSNNNLLTHYSSWDHPLY